MKKGFLLLLNLICLVLAIKSNWKTINVIGLIIVAACSIGVAVIEIMKRRAKDEPH